MTSLTKTTKPVKDKDIQRKWHLINAEGKILGRLSSGISSILQGKSKVNYVANLDMGDYVVVINAKKVVLTGRKAQNKIYTKYSGYPGGLKIVSVKTLIEKNPSQIIYQAVSRMLPKNKLRDRRLARLFVYSDQNYPYAEKIEGTV